MNIAHNPVVYVLKELVKGQCAEVESDQCGGWIGQLVVTFVIRLLLVGIVTTFIYILL